MLKKPGEKGKLQLLDCQEMPAVDTCLVVGPESYRKPFATYKFHLFLAGSRFFMVSVRLNNIIQLLQNMFVTCVVETFRFQLGHVYSEVRMTSPMRQQKWMRTD